MDSNKEMVNYLFSTKYLDSKKLKNAFLKVDRKFFVSPNYSDSAYVDNPVPIGHNQTISAPSVVSFMLEKLELKKGQKVLELGTGSGYNTALISEAVGSKGRIVTIERIFELTELAKENIERCGKGKYSNIKFIVGDGSKGYSDNKPYDRIIVTASIPSLTFSHPLISQLKKKGILVAPVGGKFWQDLVVYKEESDSFEKVLPVVFVPLIGEFGFRG